MDDTDLFEDLGLDLSAFDFENTTDGMQDEIYSKPRVYKPNTCAYEHAQDMAREITIGNETETFAFVSGDFVFGDLIEAMVEEHKFAVKKLGIMTLSLNDENIDSLRNILEVNPVEELHMVISDYWFAHERGKTGLVPYLFEQLDIDGLDLKVAFARMHCKVTTIETTKGNHLTLQGSANLRSSGNFEQLHITPDDGIYGFCRGYQERIIEAYDVVNQGQRRKRSLGSRQVWQAVAEKAGEAPEGKAAEAAEAHAQDAPQGSRQAGSPE